MPNSASFGQRITSFSPKKSLSFLGGENHNFLFSFFFQWGSILGCKVLHVLIQYFLVCCYMWTMCEGLHLFIVLYYTFLSEKKIKVGLLVLGWVLPLVLVTPYAVIRALLDKART